MKLASKSQTWKLFTLTKKDYRNEVLSYEEADKLIKEALKEKENKLQGFQDIINKADKVKLIVEDSANKLISKHELTADDISTNTNADIISINKLEIECIIGVLPEERNKAQPIFISIDIASPNNVNGCI